MLKMNSVMLQAYNEQSIYSGQLDQGLNEIAESGFREQSGCFFLEKCLSVDTNASITDFPDKTGYECFINSINVDDYVNRNYIQQGIYFVRKVFAQWNQHQKRGILVAMLFLDDFGLKVKFHLQRKDEQWLADDIDDYEGGVLVAYSSGAEFS